MKVRMVILFFLILSATALGQSKIKTRDELVKQIFAVDGGGCHIRSTRIKNDPFPPDYVSNIVECETGTKMTFITGVSFSFAGNSITRSINDFTLSFRFTTTNADWLFPVEIRGDGMVGVNMKELAVLENSEAYSKRWLFLQNHDLTILTDATQIFPKSQRYSKSFMVNTAGRNIGQISLEERIHFNADREMILQLTKAKSLNIKLGNFESALPDKTQKLFLAIAELASVQ